jgi:two-component system, cell cycle sensor histidine kinase and response regulator CckA
MGIEAGLALLLLAVLVLGITVWRRRSTPLESQRLRAILDTALDAVVSMDAAGRITAWNGRAEVVFGWTAGEAVGRKLAETIIPARFRDAHWAGLAKYLATGEGPVLNRRIELFALHKSGREFPVELSIAPLGRAPASQFSAFLRDITDRKRAEQEIRDRQAHLDGLFEGTLEAIAIVDSANKVVRVNREFARLFGYAAEECVGRQLDDLIVPAERLEEGLAWRDRVAAGGAVSEETVRRHRDGRDIPVSVLGFPVQVGEDHTTYVVYRDISSRLHLEEQLLHAQKMESIGRLAGGVAHDFNNILTAILGYLEAARLDLAEGGSPDADLAEVERAARRAAELTRQLLAFARRQVAQPRNVDLNVLTRSMDSLLTRVIGEDIRLTVRLDPELGAVRLDPNQFEQVLVNLAVNARDAMPSGGRLTIETRNVSLGPAGTSPDHSLPAGSYAELLFADSGAGMDSATMQQVFEPFFTTKAPGSGTGLGLSTCYGIIKQSGGDITVESVPGLGTTFHLFFPRVEAPVDAAVEESFQFQTAGGTESILVVEDEPQLRDLFIRILSQKGYQVSAAASGEEALQAARTRAREIDLLVTDVVLPGASGREIARQLQTLQPGLRILYVSGYAEDAIVRRGVLEPGLEFLEKPFTPAELARRVRQVLDSA